MAIASITGDAIRVSKLAADGTILQGENSVYTFKNFISFSFTPEYEDGDEFTQKNAAGAVCATFKAPDTLKRVNISIAVCNPDPVIENLLGGGTLLGSGAGEDGPLGWSAPSVGSDPVPNGVALEVWSNAVEDSKPHPDTPKIHWIFPYAKLRASGERIIQNDMLATEFEGWAVGNAKFGAGPGDPAWPYPAESVKPYAYALVDQVPVAGASAGPTG